MPLHHVRHVRVPEGSGWLPPTPRCGGTEFDEVPLSRRGTVWSYTDAQYQPPPPYVAAGDELRAVRHRRRRARRRAPGRPRPGRRRRRRRRPARSATRSSSSSSTLYDDDDARVPDLALEARRDRRSVGLSERRDVAVLGVGMHPWGKWGRNFVEYGVVAAQAALADAGVDVARHPVRRPAPTPCATATRATSPARRSRRRSAGHGARVASSLRRVRVGRARRSTPRARRSSPGCCDVALVVGADTTPKGFLAPNARRARRRPRLAALPPARRDQPDVLRALRPPPHGPLRRDRRRLRRRSR